MATVWHLAPHAPLPPNAHLACLPTCPAPQAFNVLHYQHDQHYDSHMDSFDPKDFGPQPNQRIATVLLYLSEVLEGGETVFKKEGVDGEGRGRDVGGWEGGWRSSMGGLFGAGTRRRRSWLRGCTGRRPVLRGAERLSDLGILSELHVAHRMLSVLGCPSQGKPVQAWACRSPPHAS